MTTRRLLLAALIVLVAVTSVIAMVRYTRRVEHEMTHASAAGTTLRFLKERVDVPAFAAADLDGPSDSTADFKSKVVLVNFWATWCPPCREEIPDLIALQEKYGTSCRSSACRRTRARPIRWRASRRLTT